MPCSLCHNAQMIVGLLLGCFVLYSSGCFIRNCPPGGKRSLENVPEIPSTVRRCLSCGPLSAGQCVGPNICCGSTIGCFINTPEAQVCERENDVTTPCEIQGKMCSGGGRCVADGVCCTDERCTLEQKCDSSFQNKERHYPLDTLSFLRRLTAGQRYRRSNHN